MNRFTAAGSYPVKITSAVPAAMPWPPNNPGLAIEVTTLDGTAADHHFLEVSNRYGSGAVSHLTQTQLTIQSLKRVGMQGDAIQNFQQIIGAETVAVVEESSKAGYFNVKRLGQSASQVTEISMDALMAAAGGAAAEPQQQVQAPAPQQQAQAPAPQQFFAPQQAQAAPVGFKGEPPQQQFAQPMFPTN